MISLIRYYILLASFTICGEQICRSQPCITGNYQFYRQTQIDSFPILYPGCTEIAGSVDIRSDSGAITNLLGLSTLKAIYGNFRIFRNLFLENLSGLNNLESIGGFFYIGNNALLTDITALSKLKSINHNLSIANNPSLESLLGLEKIEFELQDNLEIIENPQLSYCQTPSICKYVSRYGSSQIYHNSPGCNFGEEIYQNCNPGSDSLHAHDEICFEDGFENWIISNDSISPDNWVIESWGLWSTNGILNVERVPSINEGAYAILLRSNGPGSFEGPERTTIERKLCGLPSRVDISFTYTCRGEGSCSVALGQAVDTTGGVNWRSIWSGYTWDTIKRTVVLYNIPVNPPFSGFQRIRFTTWPIYWTGGSYGISEFVIDSVVIKEYDFPTSTEPINEYSAPLAAYPNPTEGGVNIYPPLIDSSVTVIVYSIDGQILIKQSHPENIDLSPFPKGIYFINLFHKNISTIIKVVKI